MYPNQPLQHISIPHLINTTTAALSTGKKPKQLPRACSCLLTIKSLPNREANRQVSGFPGNCHQSFKTLDEAQEFMTSTRRAFRELGIKTTCNPITHPDAGEVPPSAVPRRSNVLNRADGEGEGEGDNAQSTEENGSVNQGNRARRP
jgi:hypothetical protein